MKVNELMQGGANTLNALVLDITRHAASPGYSRVTATTAIKEIAAIARSLQASLSLCDDPIDFPRVTAELPRTEETAPAPKARKRRRKRRMTKLQTRTKRAADALEKMKKLADFGKDLG